MTVATCYGPSYFTPIATVTGHVGEDYVDNQTSRHIVSIVGWPN